MLILNFYSQRRMKIGVLKEQNDNRVAIIPDFVKQLVNDGHEVAIEKDAGTKAYLDDQLYKEGGASIVSRDEILTKSELVISIHPLEKSELSKLNKSCTYISSFRPFVEDTYLKSLSDAGCTGLSLDMIPRITIAQSMDILSSMASIAGYKAVLMAANYLPRYFPMLTTAAGSIPPAKVLILGAGVAGLQAIATAKRLGAVVEAFDTRLAAREEVQSLGAKFVEVEGARDDKAAGGYAVEQTEEYKQKQRELIFERVSKADVVITTAQLRGKPAPRLITKEMVEAMKPGAVIIDLASSTGGNCELSKDNETVVVNNVTIIGSSELASEVAQHASQLYSKNIQNYMKVFIKDAQLDIDLGNEIMKWSCVVKEGEILYGKENK